MKKTTFHTLAFVALVSGVASQVLAQPVAYISGNLNFTKVSNLPVEFSDTSAGARIGVQVNKYFAAELGYDDFGKDKSGPVTVNIRGLTVAGVARTEIAPNTWVRGSLGMIRSKAKINVGPQRINSYETEPFVGFGIEQVLNKNLSAVGEFRYAKIDDSNSRNLTLGAKYSF